MIDANDYGSAPSGTDFLEASSSRPLETDRTETVGAALPTRPATTPPGANETTAGAKDQASVVGQAAVAEGRKVAGTAKDEAAKVAGTAKEEATKVAAEAKTQVKDLYNQTRSELAEQAAAQQERVSSGLHALSDELTSMADNSENPGVATDLVQQAARRADSVANWLGNRDPGSLVDEVRDFARQRPGTFIAVAAAAGLLAGRITRSVVAESAESNESANSNDAPTMTGAPESAQAAETTRTASPSTGLNGTDAGFVYPPVPARPVVGNETYSGLNR